MSTQFSMINLFCLCGKCIRPADLRRQSSIRIREENAREWLVANASLSVIGKEALSFVSASILQARDSCFPRERKARCFKFFQRLRYVANAIRTARASNLRGDYKRQGNKTAATTATASTMQSSSLLVVNRRLCGRGKAKVTEAPRVRFLSSAPSSFLLSLERAHCARISAPQIINIRGRGAGIFCGRRYSTRR